MHCKYVIKGDVNPHLTVVVDYIIKTHNVNTVIAQ